MSWFIANLDNRAETHDLSKFESEELSVYEKVHANIYINGSPEHNELLKLLKPALDHHYLKNRHHPEHFENGIAGMNLIDVLEMFCSWMTTMHEYDFEDVKKSLIKSADRFKIDDLFLSVMINTAEEIYKEKNKS
jgi:hypothetical protein